MEIPRFWRTKDERYRLKASNCPKCEIKHFPPRRICPDCHHDNQKPVEIPIPTGKITTVDVFVADSNTS